MTDDDGLLYHYTDAAGLLGIVGTPSRPSTIWMTQVDFMNDGAEASHAYSLRHIAMKRLRGYDDATLDLAIRELSANYGWPPRAGVFEPPRLYGGRRFVFSLSPKRDLLSQWRGYASAGGYSIGFDPGELDVFAGSVGMSVQPCVYDDKAKEDKIGAEVDRLYQEFKAGKVHPDIEVAPDIPKLEKASATLRYVSVNTTFPGFSAYFKHSSFAEEREVRVTGFVLVHSQHSRWRVRGNMPMPYCEFDASGATGLPRLPVRKIVIGPKVDSLRAKDAVYYLVWNRDPKVQIEVSNCTLT